MVSKLAHGAMRHVLLSNDENISFNSTRVVTGNTIWSIESYSREFSRPHTYLDIPYYSRLFEGRPPHVPPHQFRVFRDLVLFSECVRSSLRHLDLQINSKVRDIAEPRAIPCHAMN